MSTIDWAEARKILIVKLSSLGDLIHVTPVLRTLRQSAPNAQILMAVERRFSAVLRHNPNLDGLIETSSSTTGWIARCLEARRALSAHVQPRFDLALDFQGRWRSAMWVYMSHARFQGGRGGWRPGWECAIRPNMSRHAVHVCSEVAAGLGLAVDDLEPEVFASPEANEELTRLLSALGVCSEGFVLLNPFSRWRSKEWLPERYAELIRRLSSISNLTLVVSGGRDRVGTAAKLLSLAKGTRVISLVGRLSLDQAVCLYRRARLMITGDSGPMHVAAALGTPVIALFGPTLPEQTGPWGRHCRVIQNRRPSHHHAYLHDPRREYIRSIDLETVHQAVLEELFMDDAKVEEAA